MKKFCKLALMGMIAVGPLAMVGCDDTVSKKEETKTNSDGSTKTEVETVKKTADGGTKTEHTVEKTPATQPAP